MSDYITIPLSKRGKRSGNYQATVDLIDSDLANHAWKAAGKPEYPYATRRILNQNMFMHRVIMERKLGKPLAKDIVVDHIDGDSLNNRRDNLRLATKMQNSFNSRKYKNNTSGYKGVQFDKRCGKWVARIRVNKKLLWLGTFDIPELAYEAYCKASDKYHQGYGNKG